VHVQVWNATYPTSLRHSADMREFTWKYTQSTQFNATDTLLLVSGVHFGSHSISGEIAIFTLQGQCYVKDNVKDLELVYRIIS
jgi:F-box/WD-40 domain protein 5